MEIIFDTTLERDMDLLIMEEFISSPEFANIFLNAAKISGAYIIEQAIHSMRDIALGESDIVFILNISGKRHAIHIEDKVDALAMPNQRGRYSLRAEKDILEGKYDTYSVLITAPTQYLATNQEAQKYEYQVPYEQLREYFAAHNDIRAQYKVALIDRAINDQKNGYQWVANPGVTHFCYAMDEYQKEKYPHLPQGTEAWWRGYKTLLQDAIMVYKANKGFCDLQFSNCTPQELLPRVKKHLSDRMLIAKAGKSSSVRIVVSPVDFEEAFEDNIHQVDEALCALSELYKLAKELAVE